MSADKTASGGKPLSEKDIWGDGADSAVDQQLAQWDLQQIRTRTGVLEANISFYKRQLGTLEHERKGLAAMVAENQEKIKMHKQLPYLVSNVIEILDVDMEDQEASDASSEVSLSAVLPVKAAKGGAKNGKEKPKKLDTCLVIRTSTRQTVFLPMPGLVDPKELKPSDLVGVNKDNYLVLEKLPTEYDSRVKAFEVDEKPTEDYSDIGGLDTQIQELVEAIVRPMTHKDLFEKLGITPPKGVLMYGPPGTGKTMLARACAARTKACFLKLAATELVQMFIGDGAKMIRDVFALAKEKKPAIIFIDELDAIGTKRFDSGKSGDREVQRTMLELLNQLDGFSSTADIKIIAATNRPDILDPALLRSGRLDRKIEFPLPDEDGRSKILQIHSKKMNVDLADVNFDELARSTEDFNGAQLKAVCVEAGMLALRRDATKLTHEDYLEAIQEVQAKKKSQFDYYA